MGRVYLTLGQYERAFEIFDDELSAAVSAGDVGRQATYLNNMGLARWQQGRYDEALTYYTETEQRILELGDRNRLGSLYSNIAQVYWATNDYSTAIQYVEQSLDIAEEYQDLSAKGTSLAVQGNIYFDQGAFSYALASYEEAARIFEELNQPREIISIYAQRSATLSRLGRYDEALVLADTNLELAYSTNEPGQIAVALFVKAMPLMERGQYTQARSILLQVLEINRTDERLDELINTYNTLAILESSLGNTDLSLEYLFESLSLAEQSQRLLNIVSINLRLSEVYFVREQYSEALVYATQALNTSQEISVAQAETESLNLIANIYMDVEQYDLAEQILRQGLSLATEARLLRYRIILEGSLGYLYSELGEHEQALVQYETALVLAQESGIAESEALHLHNIGVTQWQLGEENRGLQTLQQALELANSPLRRLSTLRQLGFLNDQIGNDDVAVNYLIEAIGLYESFSQNVSLEANADTLREDFGDLYFVIARIETRQGNFTKALEYTETGRAARVKSEIINGSIDYRQYVEPQLVQQEQMLRNTLQSNQALLTSLRIDPLATREDYISAEAAVRDAQREYDLHLERIALSSGLLGQEIALQSASLSDIQSALPPDTTLVIYNVANETDSFVFLVTADRLEGIVLDFNAQHIEDAMLRFESDRLNNVDALRQIYDLVFAPIADQITSSNLVISASGPLVYVPFVALSPADGVYLVDQYAISMVPSGTSLYLLSEREQTTSSAPSLSFAQSVAPGLPTLIYAESEAMAIANVLGGRSLLDATETELRESSVGEVLHISAHVELDRFAPRFSRIHLAEDDQNDGLLTVREIYELNLTSGTELVILSGCETGVVGSGDDYDLLNRAFFAIGAEKVVSSLWSVDDQATSDLVLSFVRAREATDNDAMALQQAIQETRQQYPEPYYWASFALHGVPN
jgi:CHAT domain-containing protein/tetratricopeptide (TPR) repeat protein